MVPRAVLFLLATLFASGCAAPTPADAPTLSSTQAVAATEAFEGERLPDGWVDHGGQWTLASQRSGRARVLEGRGDAEPGLSSLVDERAGPYTNFSLEVDFLMVSGEHPQGAGVVVDWRDAANYQIIRFSVSEQGWHLFTMIEGNRNKRPEATLPETTSPEFGQWVHLTVTQEGRRLAAFDGATQVLDYELPADASSSGFVGVFCRGDTEALFDDFSITPHP